MILETKLHDQIVSLRAKASVSPEEGARLSYLASRVPEHGVIVELGSCWGRSACYLAAGLQEVGRQAQIYCVDLWELGVDTPKRYHRPDAFKKFQNNLEKLQLWSYIHPIKADTAATAKAWTTPIDLLFIDAGHKYDEVLADYRAWAPKVKPGGVIAFHDYREKHPGVTLCIDEDVIPSGEWEFLALHNRLWTARRKENL